MVSVIWASVGTIEQRKRRGRSDLGPSKISKIGTVSNVSGVRERDAKKVGFHDELARTH